MEFRLVVAPATELNMAEGRVAHDLLGVEDDSPSCQLEGAVELLT